MIAEKILAVDDDRLNLEIIQEYLEKDKYSVDVVDSPEAAWEILSNNAEKYKIVLLDRMMPKMCGISFLKKMRGNEKLSNIPVVMQTAATRPAEILEGIKEGAFYYLCKPYQSTVLSRVVHSAEEEYLLRNLLSQKMAGNDQTAIGQRKFCLEIQYLEDVPEIATQIASVFPDPDRVIFGINELLINAIEHGNLQIGYDEKEELVQAGTWKDEINLRHLMPQFINRRVRIAIDETNIDITLTIQDESKGFEWEKFLYMDEGRITRVNGRGICLSNLSFDAMYYEGNGNKVVCKVMKK